MITNVRAPHYGFTNADLAFLPYFELMAGDKPPDDFESDGSSYSPDVVCGIDIRPAAHFHDFHYSGQHPGTHDEAARYQADQLFRLNLRTCGLRLLAWVYYSRVRLWGHFAYQYSADAQPKRTLWFWLRLLLARYLQW